MSQLDASSQSDIPRLGLRPIHPLARGTFPIALHAAYPNPFNPQTVVPFSVATTARIQITVFDVLDRDVVRSRLVAGEAVLDTARLPAGVYVVRAGGRSRLVAIRR